MIILRRIIDFLLYSNLWIAVCAAALVLETDLLFAPQISFHPFVWTVFFSTLFLYAVHRIIGVHISNGFTSGRYRVIQKHEWHILFYAFVSALGLAYFFFRLPQHLQIAILIAAIPSLGYVLPVLGNKKRIRDIHLIKIFLVAITWAFITVFLPVFEPGAVINQSIMPLLFERFFFIFAITC